MNEHELSLGLRAVHEERADVADVGAVRQQILAVPIEALPQRRTWLAHLRGGGLEMFSALRFVVASIIVALFGGILLTGILTTQQGDQALPAAVSTPPTPDDTVDLAEEETTQVRTDILPGVELTVEEMEPGVFHVVNDGVRDLVLGGNTGIVAGHDDGIWLLRKNRFQRIGTEPMYRWPAAGDRHRDAFEVTPDGTVWVIEPETAGPHPAPLYSFDGDGWTRTQSPPGAVTTIEVAPDGTLWALHVGDDPAFLYLGPDGWQASDAELWEGASLDMRLHPTDSDVLYAVECPWGACHVERYEDSAWLDLPVSYVLAAFDVAPDGTVWLLDVGEGLLRRYADGAWVAWSAGDLPDMGLGIALDGFGLQPPSAFAGAPDGSLWASLWQRGPDGSKPPAGGLWTAGQRGGRDRYDSQCDGLVRIDGTTVNRFLPGRCITMDIATDGSVWVLSDKGKGKDLYVITAEAVTATQTGQQKEG